MCRVHYRVCHLYSVYRHRYGRGIGPYEHGYDDAASDYNFHAIQNTPVCFGGRLESGNCTACEDILLTFV